MPIDVAFIIIMVFAIFKGFSKGLILGIFSFLAFIIGLAAALKLSVFVSRYFESGAGSFSKWLPFFSFILVFVLVAFLVNVAAKIIKKTISLAMLGWVDRIGGIFFYSIIYIVIFSVLLFFLEKTFLLKPELVATSVVHDYVSPWGPWFIDNLGKIVPVFKDLFIQLQGFFENIGHNLAVNIPNQI